MEVQEKELKIYCAPIGNKFTTYISDIIEPDYFSDLFYQLASCTDNDVFEITLNSYGGNEDTAIQLYNAICNSKATVIASVSGYCCSAGTIVLLACDGFIINPNSKVMVHSSSGGISGKTHETKAASDFESDWLPKFFKDVYKDFLTEKEIQDILVGKDLWFDGVETIKRLKKIKGMKGK